MGTGFPGYTGIIPKSTALVSRDAARQRLRHEHVRQVAQHAGAGHQPGRPVRPLADGTGVRLLLRLQPGRDAPVLPDAVPQHRRRSPQPKIAGRGLPLHRGHDRRGDRLDRATSAPAIRDKPWFVLLQHRRRPCTAPRPERVARQVQGQVRPRLGPPARTDPRAAARDGHHPARDEANAAAEGDPGVGQPIRRCRRRSTCD